MKKAALHNLGCKVNAYETEAMQEILEKHGYEIVPFGEKADVYLINTCSVTNIADRKSRQMLHRAKQKNPAALVVAVGCYVQTGREDVEQDPCIDLAIGNNRKKDLASILEEYLRDLEQEDAVAENAENAGHGVDKTLHDTTVIDINHTAEYEEMTLKQTAEHTRAYIKIQDGCNQFCSYCIIPYTRGRIRSRELDDILKEVHRLADNGYQEIVLTGIHLTSYGVDNQKGSLLEVISRIHGIEGVKRIRLGSLEPRVVTEEFVSALAAMEKVCPHFHLSLQSGCDSVLKRMNRKYTTAEYEEGCRILRKYFNNPAITTDVIVGFPQETEEEFETTYDFVKRIHFYEMHVFKYSRRKGTVADKMDGQVDEKIKTQRSGCLLALEKEMSAAYRKESLGQTMQVLIEEKMTYNGTDYMAGYTKNYIRVLVPVSDRMTEAAVNTIVNVNCKQITEDELYIIGELS